MFPFACPFWPPEALDVGLSGTFVLKFSGLRSICRSSSEDWEIEEGSKARLFRLPGDAALVFSCAVWEL